jgi:hypothetical protein
MGTVDVLLLDRYICARRLELATGVVNGGAGYTGVSSCVSQIFSSIALSFFVPMG